MSYLEDEIRGALRTEAGRLREVRPLRLPPAAAQDEPRAVHRASLARRLSAWRGPLAAAAAVVLIAVVLVALRSLWKERAAPVAPPKPIAGPPLAAGATPRFYVKVGGARGVSGLAIIVGDVQTGRTIATYPLPKGDFYSSVAVSGASSVAVSGAGDDRTFVVSAAAAGKFTPHAASMVIGPLRWYLVRIFPGAADPIRVTRLAVNFKADGGVQDMALSSDGTELAVVSLAGKGKPTVLGVYSVATGQLQHSWSGLLGTSAINGKLVSDLSWVGDGTVGFAVTDTPGVREEVRTLDTGAGGTSLLAASRVVWSQYVPAPPRGSNPAHAPQACSTPFLTGDGQAVVCATSSYSVRDKRLSALWLAYPLATPARPRVIGSVPQPADVSTFNFLTVEWTNPSGTEIIGSWNPSVVTGSGVGQTTTVTNLIGFIGHGAVRPFGPDIGPNVAW
jgi:hypothetical protein